MAELVAMATAEATPLDDCTNHSQDMAEKNKWRCQDGSLRVLVDHTVALETPIVVSVFLDLLKCVAVVYKRE